MIRRILNRLADWITADAIAEHQDTQDDAPWVFRSRQQEDDILLREFEGLDQVMVSSTRIAEDEK